MAESIYQLRITLRDSKPPIWRRVAVPAGITLDKLHEVIQILFGWTNSHLHQFMLPEARLRPSADEIQRAMRSGGLAALDTLLEVRSWSNPRAGLDGAKDERKAKLAAVCPQVKSRLLYEYDFGDSWEHLIEVQKIFEAQAGVEYPVCLAGKLAAPPDDSGGVWGYYYKLDVLADPEHEEHEDISEWMGDSWDAEAFDLDAINRKLAAWRKPKRRRSGEWTRAR